MCASSTEAVTGRATATPTPGSRGLWLQLWTLWRPFGGSHRPGNLTPYMRRDIGLDDGGTARWHGGDFSG